MTLDEMKKAVEFNGSHLGARNWLSWSLSFLLAALWSCNGPVHIRSEHFDVASIEGNLTTEELRHIAADRERAFEAIAGLFGIHPDLVVTLELYPTEATKKKATGHAGLGWAEGMRMAEVYNDSIQLDPYHELVHIMRGTVGHPPAIFDEGFAVYAAERFGADALALLGKQGMSIREAGCLIARSGEAMPLERLFDFTELGSRESNGSVSYPQSASLVQYLVEQHGMDLFLRAYRLLKGSSDPAIQATNRRLFHEIYQYTLREWETDWRIDVCKRAGE